MTSDRKPTATKDRPFPWLCIECGKREIFPLATDYHCDLTHDGQPYEIHIPGLNIPTCRNCGAQLISLSVDDQIFAALRAKAGLLTPEEIERRRKEPGLSQEQLARMLDISEEAIARFEWPYPKNPMKGCGAIGMR
jgi:DNA-binding XRE family transcriptional regulator